MGNRAFSGTSLLRDAAETLRRRLPRSWRIDESAPRERGPDSLFHVHAPDGNRSTLIVEIKPRVDPRDVPRLIAQFREHARHERNRNPGFLLVAPYVSPRTQELLDEAGVGYIDTTGNVRLALERPALFIERCGAVSNPWPEDHSLRSLKGPSSGRVVRALCDFIPPYGIRELAERSRTAAASVSRVVALLDRDAIVTKESRGRVAAVDWRALIRRWTQDYSLTSSNRTETYLEPRGLPHLLYKLRGTGLQYAVTGSLAGAARAPIAAPRLATLYVEDIGSAAPEMGLRPADSGANVLLAEPFDPVAFDRCWEQDSIRFSALSQVAADLLTSPGRGPSEGEELLKWMDEHEAEWQHA